MSGLIEPLHAGQSSAQFWDRLYGAGGTSGSGSQGRLADFKAEVVNDILRRYRVPSVLELGCGDGQQLSRIDYPDYIGLDTSKTAVDRCSQLYAKDKSKRFEVYRPLEDPVLPGAEMAISLDVIYHLLEDEVYGRYMADLFAAAGRLVVVYSSDSDEPSRWDEVRHRRFTDWVARRQPHWHLVERIPQRFPYVDGEPDTSWCDFFVFARSERAIGSGRRRSISRASAKEAIRRWRQRQGH